MPKQAESPTGRDARTLSAEANNAFAISLYQHLAKEHTGENLFFSPYSMSSALTMAAEGARGETAAEMGTVLGLPPTLRRGEADEERPWDFEPLHAGIGELERELRAAAGDRHLANAIWVERSYRLREEFLKTIERHYETGAARTVDFKHQREVARREINDWVGEKTEKRIKDLIPAGMLSELTRLVLASAVYFKGEWEEQFGPENTVPLDFALADGGAVKTPIMNGRGLDSASYAAFEADGSFFKTPHTIRRDLGRVFTSAQYPGQDGFSVAELPYNGRRLSMVLIAPNRPDGLPAIEGKLTAPELDRWIGRLEQREIHVLLPKLTLGTGHDMVGVLQAMGMVRAFVDPIENSGAQFGGMSASSDPREQLYISNVLHKAFLDINEQGTEAAAATAVLVTRSLGSSMGPEPFVPTFQADRPFTLLIRDRPSGAILFLGRVTRPKATGS